MQPRRLEFLYGIVKKLFLDKYKAKGQNPTHKVPALMQKLQVCFLFLIFDEFLIRL